MQLDPCKWVLGQLVTLAQEAQTLLRCCLPIIDCYSHFEFKCNWIVVDRFAINAEEMGQRCRRVVGCVGAHCVRGFIGPRALSTDYPRLLTIPCHRPSKRRNPFVRGLDLSRLISSPRAHRVFSGGILAACLCRVCGSTNIAPLNIGNMSGVLIEQLTFLENEER